MSDLKNRLQTLSKTISGVLLGDSPLNDKIEAAELLGMLSDDNSYYSLFEGLYDSEPEVRRACIDSIVKHNRQDTVPKVMEYLEDESPDVRFAVVSGLGKLYDPSTIPALENFIQKETIFPVREAAIKSLDEIENRMSKEEIQHLMEEKFNLELLQKENEMGILNDRLKYYETLAEDTSKKNEYLEIQFTARSDRNRKIISYLLTSFTFFIFILIVSNFFILRNVIVSRKQAIAAGTEQLNSTVKMLRESLSEKEKAFTAANEYYEKSEEMIKPLQKASKFIYGKDPVAELLYEKVLNRFIEASKLPVEHEKKFQVRESCLTITELIRKRKMDKAIDEFTKLDAMIESFKASAKTPAQ